MVPDSASGRAVGDDRRGHRRVLRDLVLDRDAILITHQHRRECRRPDCGRDCGWPGKSVYRITAIAPPACALLTFTSKLQTPRKISAICPLALPAGKGEHAKPVGSLFETSYTVAEIGVAGVGRLPASPCTARLPRSTHCQPDTGHSGSLPRRSPMPWTRNRPKCSAPGRCFQPRTRTPLRTASTGKQPRPAGGPDPR